MKVLIVGAGPAGCAAAITLARTTQSEILLVERESTTQNKTCAGGVSPWALKLLDQLQIGDSIRKIGHSVNAADLVFAPKQRLQLSAGLETVILQRHLLDGKLQERAANTPGVELLRGVQITDLIHEGSRVIGARSAVKDFLADLVIIASGARTLRFCQRIPTGKRLSAVMAWYEGGSHPQDVIEIHLEKQLLPYYGWLFPEGQGRFNLGLCLDPKLSPIPPQQLLRNVLEPLILDRWGGRRLTRIKGHPIDVSIWPRRLWLNGAFFIGEAAGLVNPISGEGIHSSLYSGIALGHALGDDLQRGKSPSRHARHNFMTKIRAGLAPSFVASELARWAAHTRLVSMSGAIATAPGFKNLIEKGLRSSSNLLQRRSSR